jgi:hypothetical protein
MPSGKQIVQAVLFLLFLALILPLLLIFLLGIFSHPNLKSKPSMSVLLSTAIW